MNIYSYCVNTQCYRKTKLRWLPGRCRLLYCKFALSSHGPRFWYCFPLEDIEPPEGLIAMPSISLSSMSVKLLFMSFVERLLWSCFVPLFPYMFFLRRLSCSKRVCFPTKLLHPLTVWAFCCCLISKTIKPFFYFSISVITLQELTLWKEFCFVVLPCYAAWWFCLFDYLWLLTRKNQLSSHCFWKIFVLSC